MIKLIKPFLLLTFASSCIYNYAQNNTSSPYSGRGLGEIDPFSTAYNKSMGGVANGIRSTRFISLSNPASLSSLKQMVFDFGFFGASGNLKNDQTKSEYYNGNFNYVILGFPIWQKEILDKDTSTDKTKTNKTALIKSYKTIWSSSIGLTPYSSMGATSYKTIDTTYGNLVNYYSKTGGLTNLFFMNAVNLSKNVSLGLNAGYIFGQIKTSTSYYINDSGVSRAVDDASKYYLKGFKFDLGIQTQHYDTFRKREVVQSNDRETGKLKKDTVYKRVPIKIIFGGTINNLTPLKYDYSRLALNKSNYFLTDPMDTVISAASKGKSSLPQGFSAGFSVRYNNLWLFAFDYSSNLYATMKNPLFNDKYTNSSQFSFGLGYKADQNPERMNLGRNKKFKSNIEYRAGFRYFNTGYNFKDNMGVVSPLKEWALTAGLGIPLLKRNPYSRENIKSMINLTMEYINRGTTKNGMVEEKLFKLTIGVTIGDIWFTKRKFN